VEDPGDDQKVYEVGGGRKTSSMASIGDASVRFLARSDSSQEPGSTSSW
jgi:hypothetical protein